MEGTLTPNLLQLGGLRLSGDSPRKRICGCLLPQSLFMFFSFLLPATPLLIHKLFIHFCSLIHSKKKTNKTNKTFLQLCWFVFETGSYHIDQASLQLRSSCLSLWEYRCALLCLVLQYFTRVIYTKIYLQFEIEFV